MFGSVQYTRAQNQNQTEMLKFPKLETETDQILHRNGSLRSGQFGLFMVFVTPLVIYIAT